VAAAAVAVAALVPLTACSAGINAETSRERPTIDGIGSAIGPLTIRNTYVGGPAEQGASVPLLTSIFNNGTEPDRLVSISSPEAGGGTVPADSTLPPGGSQLFYTPEKVARLTGVTVPVRPGEIVPIVLTFERAGELRMSVPVSPVGEELLRESAPPAPPASAAPSAAPSAGASAAPSAGASAAPAASPSAGAPAPTPSATPSITP
jgi:copper(I)-binding protein